MKKIFIILSLIVACIFFLYFFIQKKESTPKNILIVGTNAEYSPFTFVKNNTIVGFDIDIITQVCNLLDKKFITKDMPFDILIPEIQRGSIDIIAAGMTPTKQRENEVLFSKCYFTGDPLVIITPKNKSLINIEQLKNKNVIVNDGYTADLYLSKFNNINIIRLPNPATAFLALQSGRADAYVTAKSTVSSYFSQNDSKKYEITEMKNTEEKYALAISRRNADLVPEINNIINSMIQDGTIEKLKEKWGLN
ncbi:ABC transporter substrate-binding protein [Candidatus Babeliales bacterium]|nr:ABC transporter substrate-binding protein [Candidatus Babeliales bacterium]